MKITLYRNILLFIFFIAHINCASAQSQSSGLANYSSAQIVRVKAMTTMSKKDWNSVIYRLPEFQSGKVTFKDGTSTSDYPVLNYNINIEKIVVAESKDTVNLKNSINVKSITIGDHVFINNSPKGFVEKLNQTPVALGVRPLLKVMYENTNGERFAATDWELPTSKYDRLYTVQEEYYFIDKKENVFRATLPSIKKIYKPSKKEVRKYVKQNKIDFNKKDNLLQLLDFCKDKTTK